MYVDVFLQLLRISISGGLLDDWGRCGGNWESIESEDRFLELRRHVHHVHHIGIHSVDLFTHHPILHLHHRHHHLHHHLKHLGVLKHLHLLLHQLHDVLTFHFGLLFLLQLVFLFIQMDTQIAFIVMEKSKYFFIFLIFC